MPNYSVLYFQIQKLHHVGLTWFRPAVHDPGIAEAGHRAGYTGDVRIVTKARLGWVTCSEGRRPFVALNAVAAMHIAASHTAGRVNFMARVGAGFALDIAKNLLRWRLGRCDLKNTIAAPWR